MTQPQQRPSCCVECDESTRTDGKDTHESQESCAKIGSSNPHTTPPYCTVWARSLGLNFLRALQNSEALARCHSKNTPATTTRTHAFSDVAHGARQVSLCAVAFALIAAHLSVAFLLSTSAHCIRAHSRSRSIWEFVNIEAAACTKLSRLASSSSAV